MSEPGCSKSDAVDDAQEETIEVRNLVDGFIPEFLELAIHSILYHRDIYPKGFFERRKKYEIPVWVCAHPTIEKYVENCMQGLKCVIGNHRLDSVMVCILEPKNQIPVERFVFRFIAGDFPTADEKGKEDEQSQRKFYFRFSEALKAFMLRIAACKSYLKPLPPNSTCILQIVTDSQVQLLLSEDEFSKKFPWVECDDKRRKLTGSRMQSVRGSTAGVCPLEAYVEEVGNKFSNVMDQTSQSKPVEKESTASDVPVL